MIALNNFEQYYKLSAGTATLEQLRHTDQGIEGWAVDKKAAETKMDDDVVEASLLMRREGQASKLVKEEEALISSGSGSGSGSNPSN